MNIENEFEEKGLIAPRITPELIESKIKSEFYFTALQGARMGMIDGAVEKLEPFAPLEPALGLLTLCILVLANGFTVLGESACVSPANFNQEDGRKYARENAFNKIWVLEGYRLKEALARG